MRIPSRSDARAVAAGLTFATLAVAYGWLAWRVTRAAASSAALAELPAYRHALRQWAQRGDGAPGWLPYPSAPEDAVVLATVTDGLVRVGALALVAAALVVAGARVLGLALPAFVVAGAALTSSEVMPFAAAWMWTAEAPSPVSPWLVIAVEVVVATLPAALLVPRRGTVPLGLDVVAAVVVVDVVALAVLASLGTVGGAVPPAAAVAAALLVAARPTFPAAAVAVVGTLVLDTTAVIVSPAVAIDPRAAALDIVVLALLGAAARTAPSLSRALRSVQLHRTAPA